MEEPTERDLARWAKWEDLRKREAEAKAAYEQHVSDIGERHSDTACPPLTRAMCKYATELRRLVLERDELHLEGIKEVMSQDMSKETQWFWLSFRDVDTNTNLGVAIVEGGGVVEASLRAKLRGCNPGGEVMAYPLDPERLPAEELRYRLLSSEELEAAGLVEKTT